MYNNSNINQSANQNGQHTQASRLESDETHNLIGSDKVEGTGVYRSNGDKLGQIGRVMIDKRSGKVAYAVMSFGGFLGMGEDYRSIPWSALKYNTELGGYEINATDDQLRGTPVENEPSYSREWEDQVHRYYNANPYWTY